MENTKQWQQKKTQQSIIYCYSLMHYYKKKLPLFFLYLHYYYFILVRVCIGIYERLLKTFTLKIIIISILLFRIQTEAEKIRIFISFYFPYYGKSGRYFSHYFTISCCCCFRLIFIRTCRQTHKILL